MLASYTYSKMMDYATGVFNGESVGATVRLMAQGQDERVQRKSSCGLATAGRGQ